MPCSDHAVLLKATAQHRRLSTAVLCCGLEKNGMVGAWHGHDMASVNQTRTHCVNQMRKTHSKPLAARHGRGTAWTRHGNEMLCVNRPFYLVLWIQIALSSGPLWEFVYWVAYMCGQVWKLSRVPLMKTKQGRWPLFYKWSKSVGFVCLSGLRNYSPFGEAHSAQIYSHSVGIIQ